MSIIVEPTTKTKRAYVTSPLTRNHHMKGPKVRRC